MQSRFLLEFTQGGMRRVLARIDKAAGQLPHIALQRMTIGTEQAKGPPDNRQHRDTGNQIRPRLLRRYGNIIFDLVTVVVAKVVESDIPDSVGKRDPTIDQRDGLLTVAHGMRAV